MNASLDGKITGANVCEASDVEATCALSLAIKVDGKQVISGAREGTAVSKAVR
jgi:hypothetical protein